MNVPDNLKAGSSRELDNELSIAVTLLRSALNAGDDDNGNHRDNLLTVLERHLEGLLEDAEVALSGGSRSVE